MQCVVYVRDRLERSTGPLDDPERTLLARDGVMEEQVDHLAVSAEHRVARRLHERALDVFEPLSRSKPLVEPSVELDCSGERLDGLDAPSQGARPDRRRLEVSQQDGDRLLGDEVTVSIECPLGIHRRGLVLLAGARVAQDDERLYLDDERLYLFVGHPSAYPTTRTAKQRRRLSRKRRAAGRGRRRAWPTRRTPAGTRSASARACEACSVAGESRRRARRHPPG